MSTEGLVHGNRAEDIAYELGRIKDYITTRDMAPSMIPLVFNIGLAAIAAQGSDRPNDIERIEAKLDAVLALLGADDDQVVDVSTLDGEQVLIRERQEGTPL